MTRTLPGTGLSRRVSDFIHDNDPFGDTFCRNDVKRIEDILKSCPAQRPSVDVIAGIMIRDMFAPHELPLDEELTRKYQALAAKVIAALGTAGAVEAVPLTEGQHETLRRIANAKAAGISLNPFWLEIEKRLAAPSPAALDPATVEAAGPSAEQLAVLVRYLESQSDRLTKALDNPNWTPRRSHAEGDRNAFLAAANTLDQALRASNADTSTVQVLQKSAPPLNDSLPSGESGPSVTTAAGGADTALCNGEVPAAWQYRYEPDLQWHVAEYDDLIPKKSVHPSLEVRPLYANPVSQTVPALDMKGAHAAAEALFDYADNNLSMFEACIEDEPTRAREIFEVAKKLRDLLSPPVSQTDPT